MRAGKQKAQKEKAEERLEKNRVRSEKVYVDVVEKCGGIWMTENEVHEKLQGASEKECVQMLQSQLQARRHVFRDKNVEGRLNLSAKGRKKSTTELKEGLIAVVKDANERNERVEGTEEDMYASVCASQDRVSKYREQVQEKRVKEKRRGEKKRRKERRETGERVKYDDLVGKIVDHLTKGEDGNEGWYRAIITTRSKKGLKFSYDSEPGATYEFTKSEIQEDLDNGDLKVADLRIDDVVGRHVMQV